MTTQIKSRQIFDLSNVIAPKYAATKALGVTLATTLPDGAVVFVNRDESSIPAGAMVRYIVSAGLLTGGVLNTVANEQANGDINFYRSNNTVPLTLSAGGTLLSTAPLSGATTVAASQKSNTVQSTVTAQAVGYGTTLSTQATTFTLSSLRHFHSVQGSFGAGSTVTEQAGFWANSNLTGAAINYGFMGNIPAGTNRWNFYAGGTAENLFTGITHVGQVNPLIDSGIGASVAGTASTGIEISTASTTAASSGRLGFTKYSSGAFATTPTAADNTTGQITFSGYTGAGRQPSASIKAVTGTAWSAVNSSQYLQFNTCPSGTLGTTETLRLHGSVVLVSQPSPPDLNATTTLTASNLAARLITKSAAATITYTLPTGTDTEAVASNIATDTAFEWSVVNANTGNITITGNTGHNFVGNSQVVANTSGLYRTRKVGTNSFTTYRLS